MPRLRNGFAVAAAVLAVTPAAALAQGAGDDQYSDPFGSEDAEQQATPAPTPAATAVAPPVATAVPAQAPAPVTPAPRPQLPYTGFEDWLTAAAGAALLGAGLTLRRRTRADERA